MISIANYENVIWDWNGTIVDDVKLCYDIYMEQRELFGLREMSFESYRYHFQFPVQEFYACAGFSGSVTEYEALASLFITRYNEMRYTIDVHEGAEELLQLCCAKGIDNYILSAYEENSLAEMVQKMDYSRYFKAIFGLSGVKAGSKTEAGRELCVQFDLNPEKSLYIGDTIHDYEVALLLGFDVVVTTNGHNSRKRLEECCSSDVLIDSLMELLV